MCIYAFLYLCVRMDVCACVHHVLYLSRAEDTHAVLFAISPKPVKCGAVGVSLDTYALSSPVLHARNVLSVFPMQGHATQQPHVFNCLDTRYP